MRLLHLIHQYLPEHIGGTERYTQALARDQAAHGHEVNVFYPRAATSPGLEERSEEHVRVWAARTDASSSRRRFFATFRAPAVASHFRDVVGECKPDLIHIQHLMGLPLEILDYVRQLAIPFVVTLHDYWWVCANAQLITNDSQRICPGPDRWRLNCARCALARGGVPSSLRPFAAPALIPLMAARSRMLQGIIASASCMIAPAPFVCDWYVRHGFPANRLRLLPHGIERPAWLLSRQADRSSVRFAYIGGLAWQKGVHVVIQAFRQLHGPVELWIVGDESANPAYVADLRANSNESVRFLGSLPHVEVWKILGQVDAVLVPSLWYETFSLITHEALAAGVPVIASHHGVLADAIRHGVDGMLVTAGDVSGWRDALQEAVTNPACLAHLRSGVRPPLSQKDHMDHLERVYHEILTSNRSPLYTDE